MWFTHLLIEAAYLLAPLVVLIRCVAGQSRRAGRARILWRNFRLAMMSGTIVSLLVCFTFAMASHGFVIFGQVVLTAYLATSMILLLQGGDRLLWNFCCRLLLPRRAVSDVGRAPLLRLAAALLLRAVIVFCIGIPYVLATVITYRPHSRSSETPTSLYRLPFETVSFSATDGTALSGWWIPAPDPSSASRTVLLCIGSTAGKGDQLALVKRLLPENYNVFCFDFRDSGQSGGQQNSFGDLERRDVLGAVRWLRTNHASSVDQIMGIGVSTGGAALIAAAADPSPDGQHIDAIAVYGTYDRLDREAAVLIDEFIPPPMAWLVKHVGLPLASLQVGSDLQAFAPADQVRKIWPRPVLIIQGLDDELVPFEQGQALFDSALQPKDHLWIDRGSHEATIKSDAAARKVQQFFDHAGRVL